MNKIYKILFTCCLHWRFVEIIFRSKYPSSSFFSDNLYFPDERESVNFQVVFHLAVYGVYSALERTGHTAARAQKRFAPRAHEGSAKSNLRIFFSRLGAQIFGRHL